MKRLIALLCALITCMAMAACSSSGGKPSNGPSAKGSGPVNVLYAGSMVDLMTKEVGPGFKADTGYTFTGFSAGSNGLATQIKGKVHQGDVFISASPTVNDSLEGSKNGNWVSWYGTFATAPLVIGYNPKSTFVHDLKTKPWYDVITEPGFKIGRTDPATDPKGKLSAQALTEMAGKQKLAGLTKIANTESNVFPEETLVGRLQSGQLDAGFFYASEATSAKIATVPLTGEDLKATFTVTILRDAPHEAGAEAFVSYLLGSHGQSQLTDGGFSLVSPPTLTGSGVPAALSAVLPGK